MKKLSIVYITVAVLLLNSCNLFNGTVREAKVQLPTRYGQSADTTGIGDIKWRSYFDDPNLVALIDTALKNNQELNIIQQEIEIRKNEIMSRQGDYLPSLQLGVGSGFEKSGQYTRNGAVEEQLNIRKGQPFPEPLGDLSLGAVATWEVDVWKKLHRAKDAAAQRYLASVEGKNFLVTQLVSEIAETYYDLLALDNLLTTINENIVIQSSALNSVKLQKESAKATQLAVSRFQAQLLKTTNLQYEVKQRIVEAENRINFLTARYPAPIQRSSTVFLSMPVDTLQAGVPSQLLVNRPDIKQAELQLKAAKLDVQVAKANFYPSLNIRSGLGFNAFNPAFLINPQSLAYNLAGDLMAPLINRKALKASYFSSKSSQLQAVYNYEQSVLNAFVDVQNQMAKMDNYTSSFDVKSQEVAILNQAVDVANSLFNSARADYVEVLLTQEEALQAKLELIEIKGKLLSGKVNLYRSLGGGWK